MFSTLLEIDMKASDGQVMTLKEALTLEDKDGEQIKWKKQDDGTYTYEKEVKPSKLGDKEIPGHLYIYSVQPATQMATVSVHQRVVTKEDLKEQKKAEDKGETLLLDEFGRPYTTIEQSGTQQEEEEEDEDKPKKADKETEALKKTVPNEAEKREIERLAEENKRKSRKTFI